MKIKFLILFLLGSTLVIAQKPAEYADPLSTKSILDLQEAIKAKMVTVDFESAGGYTGASMQFTCKNLSNKPLRIRIPQGQLIAPKDSSLQTLVIAQEQLLNVSVKVPFIGKLRTFCTEAGDLSPGIGDKFSLAAMAPDRLCKLLKMLTEKGKLEQESAQAAVWSVSNGRHLGGISDQEVKHFAAELLGKTPPPYHIKYKITEAPRQLADNGKALVIESNFQYTLEKDDKLSLILYDSNNKQIKVLEKDAPAKAGEHRSGLKVEVWNLDSGKYYLRLKKKNGAVVKEMEVEF
jgi:hypothetical protein